MRKHKMILAGMGGFDSFEGCKTLEEMQMRSLRNQANSCTKWMCSRCGKAFRLPIIFEPKGTPLFDDKICDGPRAERFSPGDIDIQARLEALTMRL